MTNPAPCARHFPPLIDVAELFADPVISGASISPDRTRIAYLGPAHWVRCLWDHFVRNLMGETPPPYRLAEIPFDPEMLAAMGG
ncbi:MAG: hypothetical protein ACREUL_16865 [Steroidobacteraceae bacterium]